MSVTGPAEAVEGSSTSARGAFAPGRPLASLRHRDFRVLLAGTMALQTGSWVQTIGMGWLVLHDLNGSATSLGIVALLRGSSQLLIGPIGGYLAGRFERRAQLLVYQLAGVIIAAVLAGLIATEIITLWMVFAMAGMAGVVDALAGPVRMMLVYDTVEGDDLTNAVALNALGGNAMRVIGPAIGGALIGLIGTQGTFQMQALCLFVAAGLTFMLRPVPPDGSGQGNIFRSIGGGLAYVGRQRALLTVVMMAVLPSLLVYPYVTFLPVFARDVLGSNETGYGYLAASVGLGSLLGGALVAVRASRGRMGPAMVWSCLLYAAMIGAFTFARDLWVGVLFLCGAGVFHSIYSAFNASMMQLMPSPEFRSRVMSLQTMTWGVTPFSALLMGRMIDAWGAPHVVFGWVGACALVCLAVAMMSTEMRRA